MPRQTKFVICD
jgi:SAM-dependent methyltransferase/transposase